MDLPTPEELGARIERGEMTEAAAVEVMAERMRRAALPLLGLEEAEADRLAAARRGMPRLLAAAVLAVAALALCVLLWAA